MSENKVMQRLAKLRSGMAAEGLDWYIINGSDAHMSEYVAPHWRTRAFISGFTGSAGTVLVSKDGAWLWTDSRYFIQAAGQLDGSGIELMKMDMEAVPTIDDFIISHSTPGAVIGTCRYEISLKELWAKQELFRRRQVTYRATDDLLDRIWDDRPAIPATKLHDMPVSICGRSREEKLEDIRKALKEKGASCTLVAAIDDIAWITNMRGSDVECNPVFLSYLFISQDRAVLFTDPSRFTDGLAAEIRKAFEIRPYDAVMDDMPGLLEEGGPVLYDPARINAGFATCLGGKDGAVHSRDVSTDLKARKNSTELEGMRKSHVLDGVAFVNAFSKVDFSAVDGTYDEIAISSLFEAERKKLDGYQGPSFNPISGFGPHGAMCHYSATPESSARIDHDGLLVLDTGSQFDFGMTDITRTLLFGEATEEQKKDYTLVLKGHLALSRQRFIAGTRGYQLDVLAKQFMWSEGMSFYHGTGHGVGFNLNVHEGPMKISGHPVDVALEPGMVVSDEPGIYKEGRHGIRIENLVAVREEGRTEFGLFLGFEVLTLVPYERRLIDTSLLTTEERKQVDDYHKRVHDSLIDLVDKDARPWLEAMTAPLE